MSHRWRIAIGGYGPTLLFGAAEGLILAVLVLGARELGASVAVSGAAAIVLASGGFAGTLPAAAFVAKIGERTGLIAAGLAGSGAAMLLILLPGSIAVYFTCLVMFGGVGAVYKLARQSHLAAVLPPERRGIGMAVLAGALRVGLVLGPVLAGLALDSGGLRTAYWFISALFMSGALVSLMAQSSRKVLRERVAASSLHTLRDYRKELLGPGRVALLINLLRAVRPVALPLAGESAGVSPAMIAWLLSLSAVVELMLFVPAGFAMDRWGRRASAVPASVVLGVGTAALLWADVSVVIVLSAFLLGLGNGLSSGLVMTLAADLARPADRPSFLGWWRMISESGLLLGPVIVSVGTAVASLATVLVLFLPLGALSAVVAIRTLPRPSDSS